MQHEFKKFLTLIEAGSFTKASRELGLSQPALSVAIQKLERSLGTPLLTRDSTGLHLTEAGSEVYATARRLRLELTQLARQLDETRRQAAQQPLRVGMIDSIGRLLFGKGFGLARPLEVVVDNSTRLRRAVQLDQLELAFVTVPLTSVEEELELHTIGSEQFVLVAPPAAAPTVGEQMQKHGHVPNFLTYNSESTTYELIERALNKQHLTSKVEFYSTNPELLRLLVLAGRGTALLPHVLVAGDLAAKRLVEIPGLSFARPVGVIQHKNMRQNDDLETISMTVKQLLAEPQA